MQDQKFSSVKLAPPGARLGFWTELILRWFVNPVITKKISWEQCEQNFFKSHQKIIQVLESIPADKVDIRILVPPQKGLEDSSRYWSAKMLVEHLLIVGTQVQSAIIRLSREEILKELVDTAAVKPSGNASYQVLFEKLKQFASEVPSDLNRNVHAKESKSKLVHPWFGPFNSKQWYWLLGTHASIHLKQLEEIKKGLTLSTQ